MFPPSCRADVLRINDAGSHTQTDISTLTKKSKSFLLFFVISATQHHLNWRSSAHIHLFIDFNSFFTIFNIYAELYRMFSWNCDAEFFDTYLSFQWIDYVLNEIVEYLLYNSYINQSNQRFSTLKTMCFWTVYCRVHVYNKQRITESWWEIEREGERRPRKQKQHSLGLSGTINNSWIRVYYSSSIDQK